MAYKYGSINLNIQEGEVINKKRSLDDRIDVVRNMPQEDLMVTHAQTLTIIARYRKAALKTNAKDITIHSIANDGANQASAVQDNILKGSTRERNAASQYLPGLNIKEKAERIYPKKSPINNESVNPERAPLATQQPITAEVDNGYNVDNDNVFDNERVALPGTNSSTEDLIAGEYGFSDEDRERWNDGVNKFFGNPNNDIASAIRNCIPCGLRKLDPDRFQLKLLDPFDQIGNRLEDLLGDITGALGETEGLDDLCRLASLFDYTCVPDLFALISLFSLLQTRYLTELELSIDGLMSALIGALLGPMLMNITSTLDQYIDAIMNPLKCFVKALEAQLAKIDLEAAANKSEQIGRQYNRRRIEFLQSKIRSLEARRADLVSQEGEYPVPRADAVRGSLGDVMRDTGELLVDNWEVMRERQRTNTPTSGQAAANAGVPRVPKTREQQLAEIRATGSNEDGEWRRRQQAMGDAVDRNFRRGTIKSIKRVTRTQEIEKIDIEIERVKLELNGAPSYEATWRKLGSEKVQLGADIASYKFYEGVDAAGRSKAARGISNARRSLRAGAADIQQAQTFLKTSLDTIIDGIYEGQDVINTMLNTMIDELKRTMFGRVETQEDQLQLVRTLQRYTRLIGFCKALIDMINNAEDFKKQCDDRQGLAGFVSAYKKINPNDGFIVYNANIEGDNVAVITPANTRLRSKGFIEEDAKDPSGRTGLLTEKTSEYNANNEVADLNKKGILPDLGDISASKLEVEFNGEAKDLNISDNYVIMVNNFCSQVNGGEGSVESVKNWVNNL